MALNFANKHIVNKIRMILNDKNDSNSTFDDKVSIINSCISEYSSNIFNYKRIKLTPEQDGISYILPNDYSQYLVIRYENSYNQLIEGVDFYIIEGKIVLNYVGTQVSNTVKIDLIYDGVLEDLVQEVIGEYTLGNNVEITVEDSTKYSIGEYVLLKDTSEQVTEIVDITGLDKIVLKNIISNTTEDCFITGNIKIKEEDWGLVEDFARYKNFNIITSDGKTSESWTQGARQESVNYASGKSSESILENFYKRLDSHKYSKNKKTTGVSTLTISKV